MSQGGCRGFYVGCGGRPGLEDAQPSPALLGRGLQPLPPSSLLHLGRLILHIALCLISGKEQGPTGTHSAVSLTLLASHFFCLFHFRSSLPSLPAFILVYLSKAQFYCLHARVPLPPPGVSLVEGHGAKEAHMPGWTLGCAGGCACREGRG